MNGLFCGRQGGMYWNDGKVKLIRHPTTTDLLADDMRRSNEEQGRRNMLRAQRAKRPPNRHDRLMAESQNRGIGVIEKFIRRGIDHCTTAGVVELRKQRHVERQAKLKARKRAASRRFP